MSWGDWGATSGRSRPERTGHADVQRASSGRQDFHAVLDGSDRDEAGHDGRRELAAELVRSGDTPSICLRERAHQLVKKTRSAARTPRPISATSRLTSPTCSRS